MKYLFILTFIITARTSLGQSTHYAQIPKVVEKTIQNNYEHSNVFYYYFDDYKKSFLIWSYKNSTVHWKFIGKSQLKNSGSFTSSGNFVGRTVYATNQALNNSLTEFEKKTDCIYVLDGSAFGYVLTLNNKEVVGLNFINTTECLKENKSFIAKDVLTILNLNFKITTAE